MSRARDLADSADLNFDDGTLVIDSANNRVGIGTTSPSTLLHIKGANPNIRIEDNNETASGAIAFYDSVRETGRVSVASGASPAMQFNVLGSTRATIDSAGEVTIGTGTAVKTLNVYGNDGSPLLLQGSGNDTAILFSHSNVVNGAINSSSDGAIEFRVGGSAAIDEAARIDSSGNLLVGKTSADLTTAGVELSDLGAIKATRDGISGFFNRNTTDGTVIQLRKNNTTIGGLGVSSGRVFIGDGSFGGLAFSNGVSTVFPSDSSGDPSDNTHNLGTSTNRFKDLYLSGGVYLGGTGAANKLDDYEEGTWTPTVATGTIETTTAYYFKVGRMVMITFAVGVFSDITTNADIRISGLPFNPTSPSNRHTGAVITRYNGLDNLVSSVDTNNYISFYSHSTGAYVRLKHQDLNNSAAVLNSVIMYQTAS